MTKPNDGGPAFACAAENGHQPGMTLRDWFAGQAMTGTVNFPSAPAFEDAAIQAYKMADAMLAAREFKP